MQAEKIIAVEKIGKLPTMDIKVDNHKHIFYGNGIATSNSHSVGYGVVGYWTAYAKTHFPFHFFTSWLYYAKDKIDPQEETQELINDTKLFDVNVYPPSFLDIIDNKNGHCFLNNDNISFGMLDIKGIGEKHIEKSINSVINLEKELSKTIHEWSWYEFLIYFTDMSTSVVVNGLVSVGALRHFKMSRARMLFEYNIWGQLTTRERKIIKGYGHYNNLRESIEFLLFNDIKLEKRKNVIENLIKILDNPPYKLSDEPQNIVNLEQELLGIALTCSKLDACDKSIANSTCKEIVQGKSGNIILAVEIIDVNEYIIRRGDNKGKKMGFVTIGDESGSVKAVVFTETWDKNKSSLYKGNTVLVFGNKSSKYKDSLIINNVSVL